MSPRLALLALLTLTFPSGTPSKPASQPEPASFSTGTVVFTGGDVLKAAEQDWTPLEIGAKVSVSETIKTGKASVCEIRLGAETLSAKVSKLVGNDRFLVRTKTVIAGVRGTRFIVGSPAVWLPTRRWPRAGTSKPPPLS